MAFSFSIYDLNQDFRIQDLVAQVCKALLLHISWFVIFSSYFDGYGNIDDYCASDDRGRKKYHFLYIKIDVTFSKIVY